MTDRDLLAICATIIYCNLDSDAISSIQQARDIMHLARIETYEEYEKMLKEKQSNDKTNAG